MNASLDLQHLNVVPLDETELQEIEGGIAPLVIIGGVIAAGLLGAALYSGWREAEDKQYEVCEAKPKKK